MSILLASFKSAIDSLFAFFSYIYCMPSEKMKIFIYTYIITVNSDDISRISLFAAKDLGLGLGLRLFMYGSPLELVEKA